MLIFEKTELASIESCYANTVINQGKKEIYLFAPDSMGPCIAIDSESRRTEKVWEGPSGTMSLVPIPDQSGEFLAIKNFLPNFEGSQAKIVHCTHDGNRWEEHDLLSIPYIHRIDLIKTEGRLHLICCSVCSEKDFPEDWSKPGKIQVAEFSKKPGKPIELKTIKEGLHRNHGYCRLDEDGQTISIISSDEGVFKLIPPREGRSWEVRQILKTPVSDAAFCDFDGDGKMEMAVIEPFHGNRISIYRPNDNGGCQMIYQYPGKLEFCHVIWGGQLEGQSLFIVGCRSGEAALFCLYWENGEVKRKTIDKGAGPSNITVIQRKNRTRILSSNHTEGKAVAYEVFSENSQTDC